MIAIHCGNTCEYLSGRGINNIDFFAGGNPFSVEKHLVQLFVALIHATNLVLFHPFRDKFSLFRLGFDHASRFRDVAIKGERVKTIPVYPAILDCDLVINVPIVKHHMLSTSTMCMKNYMGVIDKRNTFHQDIPTCLADLTRYMKPQICVLDAVRILTNHGPMGGNLGDVLLKTTIAAGVDIVALDAWGAEVMGHKPTDIGSIVKGQQYGLGRIDYRSLALREFSVS